MPTSPFPTNHPINSTPAIWHPTAPREDWCVVLFRRRLRLAKASRPTVWISASQRFWLCCDGLPVAEGPSRADPDRWGTVEVRLPRLAAGSHVVTVRVWHAGPKDSGIGQMGAPAFLLVAGADTAGEVWSTAAGWECQQDISRRPIRRHAWGRQRPYYVVGAGERIHGKDIVADWQHGTGGRWIATRQVAYRAADPWGNLPLRTRLRPDPLPQMERRDERFSRVAAAPEHLLDDAGLCIAGHGALRIGPRQRVRLVLDRGELTNAIPRLELSGGRGTRIASIAAEASYTGEGHAKGDRDLVAGKKFFGHHDQYLPTGGKAKQVLSPLWFRSFRYLVLDIRTAAEALTIHDLACCFEGYPLRQTLPATAIPADGDWPRLWEISWRTLRLCSHETFFDCPHYEQAQFPGDTRVQAMAHYLLADDDRLARKAIDDFHAGRHADGMLECRWPSQRLQILPTFALAWIGMLRDFLDQRQDPAFLTPYLPAAREVVQWFLARRRSDGLLGLIPHAPFVDWTKPFAMGNAPQDADGGSAILSLQLAEACRDLAVLEPPCGMPELAARWDREATALGRATVKHCRRKDRFIGDTTSRTSASVHAQVHAILAGAVSRTEGKRLLLAALADPAVTQPGTFFYRYHVLRALIAVGSGNRFHDLLLPAWRRCLHGTGLTTWPETDNDAPRSDCHAWSVTPAIALALPEVMAQGSGTRR